VEEFRREIRSGVRETGGVVSGNRSGVFIDRDGTLNEERPYISNPGDLVLIPGAGAAVKKLNERGIPVCVISNQSGIARGLLSEETLATIHKKLEAELHIHGARVDRIYYCPHHPHFGAPPYRVECECRKPNPGMIRWGVEEFGLDPARSFVIGDSVVDIEAGVNAGMNTILVLTGYGTEARHECDERGLEVGAIVPTVADAVDTILKKLNEKKSIAHE
jgi:D-glycero-D-manno-heptose 1,7-bisphosphate phosphatase